MAESVELTKISSSKLRNLKFYKGFTQIYTPELIQSEYRISSGDQNSDLGKYSNLPESEFQFPLPINLRNKRALANPYFEPLMSNIYMTVFSLYLALNSIRYNGKVTMQKFTKTFYVLEFVKSKRNEFNHKVKMIKKIDADMAYSKATKECGLRMDFDVFVYAFHLLCEKFLYGIGGRKEWEKANLKEFRNLRALVNDDERYECIVECYVNDERPLTRVEMFELILNEFEEWRGKVINL